MKSAGALVLLLISTPLAAQSCNPQYVEWYFSATPTPPIEGTQVILHAGGMAGCAQPHEDYGCDPWVYAVQACDTLQWTFGDGTTATVTGSGSVSHTYAHAGVYAVKLHITGSAGSNSSDLAGSVYVASSPGTMFNTDRYSDANELDGSVTIHVTRSGDLSRTNRIEWNVTAGFSTPTLITGAGTLAFAPGETDHTLTLPIMKDGKWCIGGRYYSSLNLNLAADGAYVDPAKYGYIGWDPLHMLKIVVVHDAEQAPSLVLRDVTVRKGSASVQVPLDLIGELAMDCCGVAWHSIDGSARDGVDYVGRTFGFVNLPPNTNRTYIEIPLTSNSQPGTRNFDVQLDDSSFPLMRPRATVTIADDSLNLIADPNRLSVVVGASAKVSVALTTPQGQPIVVTVSSSDPTVADADSSATIPADGTGTILIHSLKPGRATLTMTPVGGSPASVDVQVVPGRRRAVSR